MADEFRLSIIRGKAASALTSLGTTGWKLTVHGTAARPMDWKGGLKTTTSRNIQMAR
jgi:hypothetical protein